MKTKMKKSLLVALMFGTLIGYAKEGTNSAEFVNKKTVKVEFKNVKKGQTLTIKNENGLIVYNQEIKKAGNFSKLFDLSALENGIYSVELNKDYEIIVRNFKIKDGVVANLSSENEKIFKPVIRKENNKILVSKIAFNNDPLKVIIYFKDEVIFTETVKGNEVLNRVYRLSENEKGDYRIVLNSNNRNYIKDFSI